MALRFVDSARSFYLGDEVPVLHTRRRRGPDDLGHDEVAAVEPAVGPEVKGQANGAAPKGRLEERWSAATTVAAVAAICVAAAAVCRLGLGRGQGLALVAAQGGRR